MKYAHIAMQGYAIAFQQLVQFRGFSESDRTKIRSYARKVKPFQDDFSQRYQELEKESQEDELEAKRKDLLESDIDLVPEWEYDLIKKAPLSCEDEIFLEAHIKDFPKE